MNWPSIDPGELRHQVVILQQQASSDASGNTVVMVPFVTTYAKIDFIRGVDVIRGGQTTTQSFLVVTIRWQAGILPDMQVQAESGLYIIQSIENLLGLNVVLKLNCIALGSNDD